MMEAVLIEVRQNGHAVGCAVGNKANAGFRGSHEN